MSDVSLPPALRRRSDLQAIVDDLRPYRGTTPAERSALMERLCRFAMEQIAAQPEGRRILGFQDRRSPSSLALWRRLVSEAADR